MEAPRGQAQAQEAPVLTELHHAMLGVTHVAGWGKTGVAMGCPDPQPWTWTPRGGSQDEGTHSSLPQLTMSPWATLCFSGSAQYHQLPSRLQMKGRLLPAQRYGHWPPRGTTTYPGRAAWLPWTDASSPPGSCLCPVHARWATPSPQSAGGALWGGHTRCYCVTGLTALRPGAHT